MALAGWISRGKEVVDMKSVGTSSHPVILSAEAAGRVHLDYLDVTDERVETITAMVATGGSVGKPQVSRRDERKAYRWG
jgi:hypothetical protein